MSEQLVKLFSVLGSFIVGIIFMLRGGRRSKRSSDKNFVREFFEGSSESDISASSNEDDKKSKNIIQKLLDKLRTIIK